MIAPPFDETTLPGIILAGGRATRMGGGDKGLLDLNGQTVLARVIARLGCAAAISANADPARFADYGLPVLPDGVPGHPGPLAGILAGMDWAAEHGAAAIVTAAADTPFFPPDLSRNLAARAEETGARIVLVRAGTPDGVRRHPTFGLWSTALRQDLRAALERGLHKITLWTDAQGAMALDVPGDDPFFNINTPEDLARARKMATGPQHDSGIDE